MATIVFSEKYITINKHIIKNKNLKIISEVSFYVKNPAKNSKLKGQDDKYKI